MLPVPDETLAVAVWVGSAGESDAELDQVHTVEPGKVRGRDATLYRRGEAVARVVDLPWQEEDPGHWGRAASADGRVVLAGGLGPENVAEAIAAVGPWAVDASSSLERSPGSRAPSCALLEILARGTSGATCPSLSTTSPVSSR